MTVERVDPARPYGEPIDRGARLLRAGGLVAFPTETVYGLGAHALDERALRRLFEAKGRPTYNPLIVHVGGADAARSLVREWPEVAAKLASRFWPGPLTFVLPRTPRVPDLVTAGLDTVAVRVPHHPVALALLRSAAVPVAAPSANRFTRVSPTTAEHVRQGLGDGVDLILDAGPTPVGIESTVLDLTGDRPRLLRPGTIEREALERVAGPIDGPPEPAASGQAARPSPGMIRQHYAPRGALHLFGEREREEMAVQARRAAAEGRIVGAMLRWPMEAEFAHRVVMPDDAAGYAARLYSALHEFDAHDCDLIVADDVPDDPRWAGVRDRLQRASDRG